MPRCSITGCSATIFPNIELNVEEDSVDVLVLPATLVGFDESITLKSYINSTTRLLAQIGFVGTVIEKSRAPALPRFSARGPRYTNPSILKPDVIVPRLKIIAAPARLLSLGLTDLPENIGRVNASVMWNCSPTTSPQLLMLVELQLVPVQLVQDGRCN
jgi:hypothetical protein